jgi:hypothetical protein
VSGWALAGCPALSKIIKYPELAMKSRGHRDGTMEAETTAGHSDRSAIWGWSSARIYACPPGSASALHSDLHHSHHVLALLEGGPKEYVIFPADQQTRARLLFNHIAGKFELGKLDEATGTFSDRLPSVDNVSMCARCLHCTTSSVNRCGWLRLGDAKVIGRPWMIDSVSDWY